MFKHKSKTKDFVKKQIAQMLALVMVLSSFASTGMAANTAYAEPTDTYLIFEKVDQETGDKIPGGVYGLYSDAECNNLLGEIPTTDEYTEVKITGVPSGKYYVREIESAYGYKPSDDILEIEVVAGNSTPVAIAATPIVKEVAVSVVDTNNVSDILVGTELKIQEYDAENDAWNDLVELEYSNEVGAFVINASYTNAKDKTYDDNMLRYTRANQGWFKVAEVNAQPGYINENYWFNFSIVEDEVELGENNKTALTEDGAIVNAKALALEIQITDIDTGDALEGAQMKFEYDGQEYNGTTDADGKLFLVVPEGSELTGKLSEVVAPAGYDIPDELYNGVDVVLSNTNLVDGYYRTSASYENEQTAADTTVIINNYEMVDGNKVSIAGATVKILDENGDVVVLPDSSNCEWVTGDAPITVENLPAGDYVLRVEPADGYATSEDKGIAVENKAEPQEFGFESKALVVQFSKLDGVSGVPVIGSELVILDENKEPVLDADGNEIKWETDGDVHEILRLLIGTYYLHENNAPDGYQKNDDMKFEVVDTETPIAVKMSGEDNRTYGAIHLYKKDSKTNEALNGVVFDVVSIEEVKDPISGDVIYTAGQVVDTLTTDEDGFAQSSVNLPIGTYGAAGFVDSIKYRVIEVKAADGAQYDSEVAADIEFKYVDDSTPVVVAKIDLTNDKPVMEVSVDASVKTYIGNYDYRNNVTVVNNGDVIKYSVSVANAGAAPAWNVVVRNEIPDGVKVLSDSVTNDGVYDDAFVYWSIDKIPAGETVVLSFDVKVDCNKACEIVSMAQYAMPTSIPADKEDYLDPNDDNNDWKNTDAIVYQTVKFASNVVGGNDGDVKIVSPGDTIRYHMEFTAVNGINGVVISDVIPDGLTYKPGSATINGVADAGAERNPDTNELVFSAVDAKNETVVFEFDVIVDDIEIGEEVYFENIANAEYVANPYTNENKDVEYKLPTYYADKNLVVEKQGSPDTHKNNMTVLKKGDKVEYTIVVKNNGKSVIKNVVVADVVPDGMMYVSNGAPNNVEINVNNNTDELTWHIPSIAANDSVKLKFVASVKEQRAQIIRSSASYATSDNAEMPEVNKRTNEVVYQVVELHKMSKVNGENGSASGVVSVGDTITYTIQIVTKGYLSDVDIYDIIPNGLAYVSNSLAMKIDNGNWEEVAGDEQGLIEQKDGTAIHINIDEMRAGTYYIKFDTIVDHIKTNTNKEYTNQASIEYDIMPGNANSERATLKSESVSHMTSVQLGAVGGENDDELRKNVTVVKDGEEIEYEIVIENTGASDIRNLVIFDEIPENVTFVSATNGGVHDKDSDSVTWVIDKLKADDSITVKLVVKCASGNKATEIVNQAKYAVPEDIDNIKDSEWLLTSKVIHQTVGVTKGSSIKHGTDKNDALYVAINAKFTYTIDVETTNIVYGLKVSDEIPSGLKFVAGSAFYTLPDGEKVKLEKLEPDKYGIINFDEIDELPAGKTQFSFEVTVEDVKDFDENYYFVNVANASVQKYKGSNKMIELTSNSISHKTIKTNETDTPVLGFESTSETMVWAVIAIVSAIAMCAFGFYGFVDQKKKR